MRVMLQNPAFRLWQSALHNRIERIMSDALAGNDSRVVEALGIQESLRILEQLWRQMLEHHDVKEIE
jgi:hypothetical protein